MTRCACSLKLAGNAEGRRPRISLRISFLSLVARNGQMVRPLIRPFGGTGLGPFECPDPLREAVIAEGLSRRHRVVLSLRGVGQSHYGVAACPCSGVAHSIQDRSLPLGLISPILLSILRLASASALSLNASSILLSISSTRGGIFNSINLVTPLTPPTLPAAS